MRTYLGASSADAAKSPYLGPPTGGGAPGGGSAVITTDGQLMFPDPIILNDNTIPQADLFDDLLNPTKDKIDIVWWPYYDSFPIPSASSKSGSLFLNPNNTSPWLSNLANSGRLQGDERMLVMNMRIEIWNDSSTTPMNIVTAKEILRQFYLEFWVSNKAYTSNNGFQFLESLAPIVVNTNYYALRPFIGITLPLRVPITKNSTFQGKYQLGVTPSLSGNWYMYMYIIGPLYRDIQ